MLQHIELVKSARDAQLVYSHKLLNQPLTLHQGIGLDQIITITQVPDIYKMEANAVGDYLLSEVTGTIMGQIHVTAGNPNLPQLFQLMNTMRNTGQIITGTLSIRLPTSKVSYDYQHAIFTKLFGGFTLAKDISDYALDFTCAPLDVAQFPSS